MIKHLNSFVENIDSYNCLIFRTNLYKTSNMYDYNDDTYIQIGRLDRKL